MPDKKHLWLHLLHCVHSRGLKTVLIEREDFGSGTSSKSTKLVHGGVRYLEKAFWHLDYSQLKLVWEALHVSMKVGLRHHPHGICMASD